MGERDRRQQAVSQTDAEVSHFSRVPARWRGGSLPGRSENHGMWHGGGVLVAARGGERIGRCGRLFVWLLVCQVHLVYKMRCSFLACWQEATPDCSVGAQEAGNSLPIVCQLLCWTCWHTAGGQLSAVAVANASQHPTTPSVRIALQMIDIDTLPVGERLLLFGGELFFG